MNRINIDELDPSSDYLLLMYRDEPFTGVAYEESDAGALIAEVNYVNGQKAGIAREWAENGVLTKQQHFAFDSLHGLSREWYENGNLKIDSAYELGICVSERQLAPDGSVIREFVLQQGSPQFATLEKLRTSAIGRAVLRDMPDPDSPRD